MNCPHCTNAMTALGCMVTAKPFHLCPVCGTHRSCEGVVTIPAVLALVRYGLRLRTPNGWQKLHHFPSPAEALAHLDMVRQLGVEVEEWEMWESLPSHDVAPVYAARQANAQAEPEPARVL